MFAVRSGGHSPLVGTANINAGVKIDLRSLNFIDVSLDKTVAFVGAGSIWDDVCAKLVPMGLVVVGARVAGLGVGGFTTGGRLTLSEYIETTLDRLGGISFFSPQRGFGCDNVVNMEVVLADGQIVNANPSKNPELFTGGSNNFGIMTRFDYQTYSQHNFWGGFIIYPGSTAPKQLAAFENFMNPKYFDPFAEMICAFGYQNRPQVSR